MISSFLKWVYESNRRIEKHPYGQLFLLLSIIALLILMKTVHFGLFFVIVLLAVYRVIGFHTF